MTKLSNTLRSEMARRLVAHRYADELATLQSLNEALFDRTYKHLFPDDVLAAMTLIKQHFPNEFSSSNWLRVNASGFSITIGGQVQNPHVEVNFKRQPERLVTSGYVWCDITGDETLAEDIKAFALRRNSFDGDCITAYHEALAVLATISTTKALAKAWPEALPVIGDLIPAADRTVPVVQVDTINAKFGLPPEDAEAA